MSRPSNLTFAVGAEKELRDGMLADAQAYVSELSARKAAMLRREAAICRARGDDEAAAACDAAADYFDPTGQVPAA